MSDLSAAPLETSLHIGDLGKFLGHIRFVLGLGIILSPNCIMRDNWRSKHMKNKVENQSSLEADMFS